LFRIVNASGGAVYRSRNEPIMHLHSRILAAIPAVVLALHAHPQAMGNLMYETNSRIFFQQAEQPVKASIQGNMLMLEVNAMMNMKADSYLAIFHITQLGPECRGGRQLDERAHRRFHTVG
jgi:hypothetical protein